MKKKDVNEYLKYRIGFSTDEEIEDYRKIYKKYVKNKSEKDFYYSMLAWFFDGNAPYYENYIIKYWIDYEEAF